MKHALRLNRPRYLLCTLLLFFVSFLPLLSGAQNTAQNSGSWNDAGNWSDGSVPDASDFVLIPAGVDITIDAGFAAVAGSIQINNGATNNAASLTLANGATLTVGGVISLGNSNPAAPGFLAMTDPSNTITTGGFAVDPASTSSLFTDGGGSVELTGNNTIPAIGFGTFHNLTLLPGIFTTASSALQFKGNLTVNTGSTLIMGASDLSNDVGATLNNNGTITTASISGTPIPSSMDYSGAGSGTVVYNAPTGGQSIVGGTYGNLYVNSGTGTTPNLALGDIAVAGLISAQTATTIIDLGTFQLTATTGNVGIGGQTNVGIIRTAYVNGSNPAIPVGRTWGGTIVYYAASGQKILNGTYNNLMVLANGTDFGSLGITINGSFASSATTIIDLASEQLITGAGFDATGFLGTLQVQAATNPIPAGSTWGGTIQYNGTLTDQEIVSANYTNLILSNYRNHDIIFPANINVAGNLTITADVEGAGNDFVLTGSTVTLNGTGPQAISITGRKNPNGGSPVAFQFNNLTLAGAGVKTLNTDLTLAGLLTLSTGELAGNTAGQLLILLDGATTTGGSTASYISARVQRLAADGFTFPLGKGGVFAPLTITAPGTGGDVTVQYLRADPHALDGDISAPLLNISACEYWFLKKNAGAAPDFTATIGYSAQSSCNGALYVGNPAALRVARLLNGAWEAISSAGSLTSDPQPDFDFITIGTTSAANPLPVRFLTVRATRQQGAVSVRWSTATEVNVARYEVERSTNGRDFTTVTQTEPRGTNGNGANYEARDAAAPAGRVFYRVKGVDLDGHLTYSNAVRLDGSDARPEITIVPNPAIGRELALQATGFAAGTYELALVDPGGRIVFRQRITQEAGSSSRRLTLPGSLPAGVYHLRIEGKDGQSGVSILLQ
ncbi:MAG: hypothetical protein EOO16_06470 [Chitinophagaceae bacterium]|nr:MAG: hypothetical protein EOO16_06470 [Chitinophagaceae bacterium]